jgi:hypothetical protein
MERRFAILGLLVAAVVLAIACGPAEAANLETLLMPGAVIAGHAKFEQECSRCHDRADRGAQPRLCRTCHEPVDRDIAAGRGYHGRLPQIAQAQCSACHTEHRGRNADIVKFQPAALDHARTDFPLQGAHATVACGQCHKPGKKYRDPPTACVDCHGAADPHAGRLGRDCASCHDVQRWGQARFDHAKTRFALLGRHADTTCAACHFDNRYAGTPTACAACHTPDDVHAGSRGPACADCHSPTGWTGARYDHLRATGFALVGTHARLDCKACHTTAKLEDPLPRDCAGCHRVDDPHATRLGDACDRCHGSTAWKPATFDHARNGRFELRGVHARLDCHACHTAVVASQKLGTECAGCHRASDVHAGRLDRDCAQCHGVERWRESVQFDHDFSAFPLVGLHVAVPCFACHRSVEFKGAPQACADCHAADDRHRGSLGRDCAGCHSPGGWNLWEFDHGKATRFALTGAHAEVACEGCHKQAPHLAKPARDCASCHGADDVHLGQYGRECQRCHVTTTFKAARLQ